MRRYPFSALALSLAAVGLASGSLLLARSSHGQAGPQARLPIQDPGYIPTSTTPVPPPPPGEGFRAGRVKDITHDNNGRHKGGWNPIVMIVHIAGGPGGGNPRNEKYTVRYRVLEPVMNPPALEDVVDLAKSWDSFTIPAGQTYGTFVVYTKDPPRRVKLEVQVTADSDPKAVKTISPAYLEVRKAHPN